MTTTKAAPPIAHVDGWRHAGVERGNVEVGALTVTVKARLCNVSTSATPGHTH